MPKTKKIIKAIESDNQMTLVEIKTKSEEMQEMVDKTQVTTEPELKLVSDKIKSIKMLGKFVKAEKEKYTNPAQQIINEARAKYLPYEKMCKDAEDQLKNKADQYMTDVENVRLAKEKKIADRAETGNIKEETAVKKMEELGEEKKSVSTGSSQIQRKMVRTAFIMDREKVPHEYWDLNESRAKRAALAGANVPGVEVREVSQMAIK